MILQDLLTTAECLPPCLTTHNPPSAHTLQLLPHFHGHHTLLGQIHNLLRTSALAQCRGTGAYRAEERGVQTRVLLPPTSSSQPADSGGQNPTVGTWPSADPAKLPGPLRATALRAGQFLSTPTRCKASQRRGSWKSKRKAMEYNARGTREKINKD